MNLTKQDLVWINLDAKKKKRIVTYYLSKVTSNFMVCIFGLKYAILFTPSWLLNTAVTISSLSPLKNKYIYKNIKKKQINQNLKVGFVKSLSLKKEVL